LLNKFILYSKFARSQTKNFCQQTLYFMSNDNIETSNNFPLSSLVLLATEWCHCCRHSSM